MAYQAPAYPDFSASGLNFDYSKFIELQSQVLKNCLHDWGVILRSALRRETGLRSSSELYQAIRFRVYPQNRKQITGTVQLMVGILDPESEVLSYLKFFLYGTRKHFVPIINKEGIPTGILQWAQKNGMITDHGGKWIWNSGKLAGKPFTGVPEFHNVPNDFFQRVYDMYNSQITGDIKRILEGGN